MSGWGGVILSGLAGAASGVGAAGYADIIEKEKREAEALRDQRLAQLTQQTQINVNAAASKQKLADAGTMADTLSAANFRNKDANAAVLRADEEAKSAGKIKGEGGRVVAKGSAVLDENNKEVYYNNKLSPEELDILKYNAETRRISANAASDAHKDSQAYREAVLQDRKDANAAKMGAGDLPKWEDLVGEGGMKTGVKWDPKTMTTMKMIPETAATDTTPSIPAHLGFFSPSGKEMTPDSFAKKYPKLFEASGAPSDFQPAPEPMKPGMVKGVIGNGIGGGATQPSAIAPPPLSIGTVRNGYKYKGGDPNVQSSWEQAR